MKRFFVILGLCLLGAYMIFSAIFFEDKPQDHICHKLDIEILNGDYSADFVEVADIERIIKEKNLSPVGRQIKAINTSTIEDEIRRNNLVKDAYVYVTDNSTVKINVVQRKPVLRIMTNAGENYYIDSDGEKMALSKYAAAYVPIATGAIKEGFAKGDLYKFALFLSNDTFWDAQVEQIVVSNTNEIRLIPRVGDQQIILGNLDGYPDKLNKLMLFYQKGQNKIGWNKYSVLNLKYDKQIVCTKR